MPDNRQIVPERLLAIEEVDRLIKEYSGPANAVLVRGGSDMKISFEFGDYETLAGREPEHNQWTYLLSIR